MSEKVVQFTQALYAQFQTNDFKRHKQLHSEMLLGQRNNNSRCSNKLFSLSHYLHGSCKSFYKIIRSHCLYRTCINCTTFEFTFCECNIFCKKDTLENLVTESAVQHKRKVLSQTASQWPFAQHPNICLRACFIHFFPSMPSQKKHNLTASFRLFF